MTETMQPYSTAEYTVLRIKRKATEPPLSSLVIQGDSGPAKKRREIKGRGVFRLAETVPDTWKGTGEEEITLKERIRGLLSSTEESTSTGTIPSQLTDLPLPVTSTEPTTSSSNNSPRDATLPLLQSYSTSAQIPSVGTSQSAKQMRYRVVPPPSSRRGNFQAVPPRVITYAEEESGKPLTFVDAEAIASNSAGPSRKESLPSMEEQKEMAPFLSMLEDVLKLENKPELRAASRSSRKDDGETYVYDLYYKDVRPASTPLPLGVGDGVHIGALLGYGDDDDEDGSDVSEPEDEADEDSNDEDYYRNDYPEDEDADEDMQGFRDAFDDSDDESYNNRGDGDEPGLWDYR